jgi:hypothetical protein
MKPIVPHEEEAFTVMSRNTISRRDVLAGSAVVEVVVKRERK